MLFLHLIGFALLLGAAVAQYVTGQIRINAPMVWGSAVAALSGMVISVPVGAGAWLNPAAIITKLVIAASIFAMVFFSSQRQTVNRGHFLAIIGLTLVNAMVGILM